MTETYVVCGNRFAPSTSNPWVFCTKAPEHPGEHWWAQNHPVVQAIIFNDENVSWVASDGQVKFEVETESSVIPLRPANRDSKPANNPNVGSVDGLTPFEISFPVWARDADDAAEVFRQIVQLFVDEPQRTIIAANITSIEEPEEPRHG